MKDLRVGRVAMAVGARRTLSFAFAAGVLATASGWEVSRAAGSRVGDAAPRSGEPAAGRTASVQPAFDLGAVMEQVHYAFREREGAWRAGHTTYEVALRDGVLEVRPWHHPSGAPHAASPEPRDRARPSKRDRPGRAKPVEGSAARFGPARLERGGTLLVEGLGMAAPGDRGQLDVAKGSITERLTNGPTGVEQSWRLAQLPGGRGDLEVRVPLATGAFVGETEGGLHFSAGALGVRYGHGTWIDGLGNATPVPARWDGRAVVLTVPAGVLEGSIYPATLDPIISPELGMDEPVYGPAAGRQDSPAMASDGNGFLVVWEDYWTGEGAIHGTRVSASGDVLDPAGIAITAAEASGSPAVAWGGSSYLVVWETYEGPLDIRGARVSASGTVLDAATPISTASENQTAPAVAWSGTAFLVVWTDDRNGTSDIYGARVSASGTVLDAEGVPISAATGVQATPAVAWGENSFLVVWGDFRGGDGADIYGTRVAASGTVLDAEGIPISTASDTEESPAVAWSGSTYLVVWSDWSTDRDIRGARVSASGEVLDTEGIPISAATTAQIAPALAWDGGNYLVVWEDHRSESSSGDIYGARVSPSGSVLDPAGIAIASQASGQYTPALAWSGSTHLVAWIDEGDVFGARVSASGSVLDEPGITIATGSNPQSCPAVAWGGSAYLVAWVDQRNTASSSHDVYGARVSASGSVLDPAGIAISTAEDLQYSPAVAWNGSDYLVVWEDRRNGGIGADVYGARVSASGAVLDADGIPVSTAWHDQRAPSVASDGTDYLVVWSDNRSEASPDLYCARVSASGGVLDADGIPLSAAHYGQHHPAVVWGAGDYFVVWHDERKPAYAYDVYGARVSRSGSVLDPEGILISSADFDQSTPALAWNGSDYLVVWEDQRNEVEYTDIYGARVSGPGVVLDPAGIPISVALHGQNSPEVAWDGSVYLVVWQHELTGEFEPKRQADILATRVSVGGGVLDGEGFLVSGSAYVEELPRVASPGARRFLVLYQGFDEREDVATTRVLARDVLLDTPPEALPQTVTTDEDVPITLALEGTDADGDALTYVVKDGPTHGTLSDTGGGEAAFTYEPDDDYAGADAFTFAVSDGWLESEPATVSIAVRSVNDAPVALGQSVTTDEDVPVAVVLEARDVEGDALTFAVLAPPTHGSLGGTGADLTYTPAAGYHGADGFTFKANDGALDSAPATVSITVGAVNRAPVAIAQTVRTNGATTVAIVLTGTDEDGDALTYAVVAPPSHGSLGGAAPDLTYTPTTGYSGPDAFTFKVNDGRLDSPAATVTLDVTLAVAPSDPGDDGCGCGTGVDPISPGLLLFGMLALRRRPRGSARAASGGAVRRRSRG